MLIISVDIVYHVCYHDMDIEAFEPGSINLLLRYVVKFSTPPSMGQGPVSLVTEFLNLWRSQKTLRPKLIT